MDEIKTILEIEMTEELKNDFQKRICLTNKTPSEYLTMLIEYFDAFNLEADLSRREFLKNIKIELENQHILISKQWSIINDLKEQLHMSQKERY